MLRKRSLFELSFCVLLFAALAFGAVAGDEKYNVPRGAYPFMAFIYYSDETIVDSTGNRFVRGAVLIRNEWLVSSAIAPDDPNGFPRKTLLARAGSIAIDANFTLNEDVFEQEREIIQIIRPYNHSATEWWRTDISLMKTLLPFNSSSAVGFYTLNVDHLFFEKSCTVLVFVKTGGNLSEDKILMKMPVEMLSPSLANCGNHFINGTMVCAADSDDDKESVFGLDFCQGNSGGPLICEGEVRGLQTYIGNNCKQPYLYQLLTEWKSFINCGIEEKCQDEECAKVCDITNKDAPKKPLAPVRFVEQSLMITEIQTPAPTTSEKVIISITDDLTQEVSEAVVPTLTSGSTTTKETSSEPSTASTSAITPTTTTLTTETTRKYVTEATTTTTEPTDDDEEVLETTRTWPKEKPVENKIEEQEIEREVNAEAHRQELKEKTETSHSGSTAVTLNMLLLLFTLACLI